MHIEHQISLGFKEYMYIIEIRVNIGKHGANCLMIAAIIITTFTYIKVSNAQYGFRIPT